MTPCSEKTSTMAKDKARVFGQDLMRGEHVVGGGMSDKQRPGGLTGTLMKSLSSHPRYYEQKTVAEERIGRKLTNEEFETDYWVEPDSEIISGTSIFDPVLCELAYTWFTAPDAAVLDPFAGGSVRGIIAAYLGRHYTGIDLRPEQAVANEAQGQAITPDNCPTWIVGDSLLMDELLPEGQLYDFVFSCPPYADLEVYSDDPRDISTMDYPSFLAAYREIVRLSVARLRDDRFACFVVGDVRDKHGHYYNFVGDTVQAFTDAGCQYYNEAVLVTAVGSLPIRVGRQFEAGRKLGKTHQNVLVFVKGDGKRATEWCGPVEVANIAEAFGDAA